MHARSALLPLLAVGLALAAGGRAEAQPSGPPKAVVELFTSQGCASCPPADALLEELAHDPQIIAVTLAVDYWDYIGWKDTLAKHGHSLRQKAYAEQRGDRMIYTPQMVVNGFLPAKGSDKAAVLRAVGRGKDTASTLSVPVNLSVKGSQLVVDVGAAARPGQSGALGDIWLCPVIQKHEVAIGRGENAGKTVTYTNVVRGWVRLGSWTGHAASFTVPIETLRGEAEDGVVVLVQSGTPASPGPILGAGRVALEPLPVAEKPASPTER